MDIFIQSKVWFARATKIASIVMHNYNNIFLLYVVGLLSKMKLASSTSTSGSDHSIFQFLNYRFLARHSIEFNCMEIRISNMFNPSQLARSSGTVAR